MRRRAQALGVMLALGAAGAGAALQGRDQPQQQPPVFRGAANFVYVDVYPRRGETFVGDLAADDFQVLEDGKPQQVQTFELIRIEPNAPDSERRDPNTKEEGDRLAADPHNRLFVVYLDAYHVTFIGEHAARLPLLQFLQRTIGPGDLFGVLVPETPIQQLVFGRRIDTLEYELAKYFDWASEDKRDWPRTDAERRYLYCPNDGQLLARYREDLLATSLEDLMVHLRDLRDERKNVILISEGWQPQRARPAGGSGELPRIGPGPGGRLGIGVPKQGELGNTSWCDAELTRLTNIDFEQRFRDLLVLANRANVSFYPIDVGGLKPEPGFEASRRGGAPSPAMLASLHNVAVARRDTLRTLAENTDGRAIVDSNDLGGGFRKIADDLSAYYLLGYASSAGAHDGKFHRIDVRVRRPGVKVTARRGYLAAPPETTPLHPAALPAAPLTDELGRLSRLRPDAELFSYGVRTPAGIDVVAELPIDQIGRGKWRDGADVEVIFTSAAGIESTVHGRIEPGARATVLSVPLKDTGAGIWRALVRASQGVDRADDRLEVAPPSIAILGPALCFRGSASARVTLQPVADFQFRRNERLHVEWPLLKPLDRRTARLLDRRGDAIAVAVSLSELAVSGTSTRGPIVSADLNLAPLAEGDYLIEVSAGSGADAARSYVAFRVIR